MRSEKNRTFKILRYSSRYTAEKCVYGLRHECRMTVWSVSREERYPKLAYVYIIVGICMYVCIYEFMYAEGNVECLDIHLSKDKKVKEK